MKQVELRLRRRANVGEQASTLHRRLIAAISEIEGLWADDGVSGAAHFSPGLGESAATDLSPCLRSGLKGAISFASRAPAAIVDRATSDDVLTLFCNTELVEFNWLAHNAYRRLKNAFQPKRRADVCDAGLDLDDFELICAEAQESGRDVDGRDTVFRIHPISFFDAMLCQRAFGRTPRELVKLLSRESFDVEPHADGLLIKGASSPSTAKELQEFDRRARAAIEGSV